VSARKRTARDERRRRLGQNFLDPAVADQLIERAAFRRGEVAVEIGAGSGVITLALARRGIEVIAVEPDPVWYERLRARVGSTPQIRIVNGDFLALPLPREPFRVVGSLPFGQTTDMLRRLLDDPHTAMRRADLIVQWDVARKRAATPPTTLLSTLWAPWWEFHLGFRIPATEFRPIPRVDGGLLTIKRRDPPVLPLSMAEPYADFVHRGWPFYRRPPSAPPLNGDSTPPDRTRRAAR
jgi:23S rRNA (adenine-N6)-dimethyltransferase